MSKDFIKHFPVEALKYRLGHLTSVTVKEAKRYCEPERVESWVAGYTTAINDVNQIIDMLMSGRFDSKHMGL